MKFNPYAVLLTTGALMLATVLFAQLGTSMSLLKAGAESVDADVSSLAAKTASALGGSTATANSTTIANEGSDESPSSATRVASTERSEPRRDDERSGTD
jgi:hypothetical protein